MDVEKCPAGLEPEFAFIGRSNVGKSSLINYLVGRKALSKVSNTPGKTQTLNFFKINNKFHFVDLPGYSFAKVSKEMREKWIAMIRSYLKKRKQLLYVCVLIDSRIPPQKVDLEFMDWLGANHIPFIILFTKADKPGKKENVTNIQLMENAMLKNWEELPPMIVTSAIKNIGKEEMLQFFAEAMAS